ncbi:unnamed protein product [Pylaiella littoralis]
MSSGVSLSGDRLQECPLSKMQYKGLPGGRTQRDCAGCTWSTTWGTRRVSGVTATRRSTALSESRRSDRRHSTHAGCPDQVLDYASKCP